LSATVIYEQVFKVNHFCEAEFGKKLTNIVYMGMGEPLLSYRNVKRSMELISSDEGLNMSARRITVSTAGISKMIQKIADDGLKCKLALSLHAPFDEKRDQIMPINETNKIEDLMKALQYYYHKPEIGSLLNTFSFMNSMIRKKMQKNWPGCAGFSP